MFTGIIEEKGTLRAINKSSEGFSVQIQADAILSDLKVGDSVAVEGVCLTVTKHTSDGFFADVSPETIKRTTFCDLHSGSKVNLERALSMQGRLGGHFVSGHVDVVGKIVELTKQGVYIIAQISVPVEFTKYLAMKGSVAVDGASLTIMSLTRDSFSVSLIPHTLQSITLFLKKKGDLVNVEFDLIAKYLERLAGAQNDKPGMSEDFLKSCGF
ncbi:MAG: riboflavin synthase [Candidatus Riflebacteria bacterium]|nr:riboflavin synthase [Candidatus Riflebacteria bacterium]